MSGFGKFGFGSGMDNAKLSKMLLQAKQISSDITNIIPVSLDSELNKPAKKKTPIYEELTKFEPPESTYKWGIENADNFGKFVNESNAASRFAAQKGTYATPGSVDTTLMSYVLNIGMIAQKNASGFMNLVREEQQKGIESMRKGIERCLITGHPATAASDGSAGDSLAFQGLDDLVTTNVDVPTSAEAISLDKLDAQIDACISNGAVRSDLMMVTDTYTHTKIGSLFYNLMNAPLSTYQADAGIEVDSYRRVPIFDCDYCPTTSGVRKLYIIDKNSTKIPEFWPISQLDLGRTELSDDSIMFWMGALAVKEETRNAIITKVV